MAIFCLCRRPATIVSCLSSSQNKIGARYLKQYPRFLQSSSTQNKHRVPSFAFAFEYGSIQLHSTDITHTVAVSTVFSSAPPNHFPTPNAPSPTSNPTAFPSSSSPMAAASQSKNVYNSSASSSKYLSIPPCSYSPIHPLRSLRMAAARKA